MHNQYNNAIDKVKFRDDYKEKLMNTLGNSTSNMNCHVLKRTVVGKILIRQKIRKMAYVLIILIFALAGLSTKPIQAAIRNVISFIFDGVYQNYETNMRSYKDKINESVTVDGITLNIYDIVMGKHGMDITYNLVDEDGNAVVTVIRGKALPLHSMRVLISDNKNRTVKGHVEYREEPFFEDDLPTYLTIFNFEDADNITEEWVNSPLDININIGWIDNDNNPIIKNFHFTYTPKNIYSEKIVNINQKIVMDNGAITVSKLTLNGLYMKIEAEYTADTNKNRNFYFKAVDDFGKEIVVYEYLTESSDESDIVQAAYKYKNVNENVSKIYLIPCYDKLLDNGLTETIQLNDRIEIEIPKE